MIHRHLILLAGLFIALTGAAAAQGVPELITDRPDYTESPVVVPKGSVQLEIGATQTFNSGEERALVLPEALIRWAPLSWMELRFMLPDYVTTGGVSRFGDAGIGTKIGFGSVIGWDVAAILGVSLPTGADGLSSERFDPEALLTIGRDFGDSWSMGLQGSMLWLSEAADAEFAANLVVGTDIAGSFGTFLELSALVPPGSDLQLLLHHGYTVGISSVVQLDVHGAVGLTEPSPTFLIGAGAAIRL